MKLDENVIKGWANLFEGDESLRNGKCLDEMNGPESRNDGVCESGEEDEEQYLDGEIKRSVDIGLEATRQLGKINFKDPVVRGVFVNTLKYLIDPGKFGETWDSYIKGNLKNGMGDEVKKFFQLMRQTSGASDNWVKTKLGKG